MKKLSIFAGLIVLMSGCLTRGFNTGNEAETASQSGALVDLASRFEGECTPDKQYCAYFSPIDIPVAALAKYLANARKSIRIATYNMDVPDYVSILKKQAARGVKVEFIVDYKLSHSTNLVWNQVGGTRNIERYRLPVMRGSNPQMHNKIIIIDDEVVLFGSANWTLSGLVANYENTLAARNPELVKRFTAEFNELKDNAHTACTIFAKNPDRCGSGSEDWDRDFHQFLTSGELPRSVVDNDRKCKEFSYYGLFNRGNQPRLGGEDLRKCIKDERYVRLAEQVAAREEYTDGTRVSQDPPVIPNPKEEPTRKHEDKQTGKARAYFGPEDNLQDIIVKELEETKRDTSGSFVYASTNFITNKYMTEALVKLHSAGVRMRIFFDGGRYDDPEFQQMISTLRRIGIVADDESGDNDKVIKIFRNKLTGPYGAVHNKWAVVKSPSGLKVITGSANWSKSAVNNNDENLVVIEDEALGTIYLREMVSELFAYRYMQDPNSKFFQDEIKFLTRRVGCLEAALGMKESCRADGRTWKPNHVSHALLSLEGAPVNPNNENAWVWVAEGNNGYAVRMFTHEVFSGRWLTSIPLPLNGQAKFKFFKAPASYEPRGAPPGGAFEYGGIGNDRTLQAAPLAVHVIKGQYKWGNP